MKYSLLEIISFLTMLSIGFLNGAIGALIVAFSIQFDLQVSQIGYVAIADAGGYLLGTFIASLTWRLAKAKSLLSIASLLLVLFALGPVFFHSSFQAILVFLLLMGITQGFLVVGLDSYYSETLRSNLAGFLNFLHIFYGLGAFFGPLLISGITAVFGEWFWFYLLVSLIQLAPAICFHRWAIYKNKITLNTINKDAAPAPLRGMIGSALFWIVLAAAFMGISSQSCFNAWTPIYLVRERGFTENSANICLSAFWLALIAGRAIYVRFFRQTDLKVSLLVAAAISGLGMVATYALSSKALVFAGAAGSGLFMSIIYPNLMALTARFFPDRIGVVVGAQITSSGLGHAFFPWCLGLISQSYGLSVGILLAPALHVGLIGSLLLMKRHGPRFSMALCRLKQERFEPRD